MSSSYENNSPPVGIHKLQLNLRLSSFFSDKIQCISQPVLNELTKVYPSIEKKSVIGGAGINLNSYSTGCPSNIRKEFSISTDSLLLVSVGHAVPVKGWDILLIAYSKFLNIFPQSKLLLVGSTELENEKETFQSIMQLLETLSLKNNVILTGKRYDIPDILAATDIYVQPSRSEGLCLALIEALAAGLPSVASNVGGIKDIIHNGKNGLLFEREDVNGLTENILRLAQDPVLQAKLSSNALPSVQHYGLENVVKMNMNIYKELLINKNLMRAMPATQVISRQ
jgi:glycosyltransferase involved in cell wall biosynthesis